MRMSVCIQQRTSIYYLQYINTIRQTVTSVTLNYVYFIYTVVCKHYKYISYNIRYYICL